METTTNTYDVTGFAAFKVDVTVDSNGKIVSVSVPENNETPGFGADLIADHRVCLTRWWVRISRPRRLT